MVQTPTIVFFVHEAFNLWWQAFLHVITRFTRKDYGHLEIAATIDDPKAYTKPWGNTVTAMLLPDGDLMEFICLENEKDTRRKWRMQIAVNEKQRNAARFG